MTIASSQYTYVIPNEQLRHLFEINGIGVRSLQDHLETALLSGESSARIDTGTALIVVTYRTVLHEGVIRYEVGAVLVADRVPDKRGAEILGASTLPFSKQNVRRFYQEMVGLCLEHYDTAGVEWVRLSKEMYHSNLALWNAVSRYPALGAFVQRGRDYVHFRGEPSPRGQKLV